MCLEAKLLLSGQQRSFNFVNQIPASDLNAVFHPSFGDGWFRRQSGNSVRRTDFPKADIDHDLSIVPKFGRNEALSDADDHQLYGSPVPINHRLLKPQTPMLVQARSESVDERRGLGAQAEVDL